MAKLKKFKVEDIRTGHYTIMRAKSKRTLEARLGARRADQVLISLVKKG